MFVKYVYRYLKSIFPKVDETILLDILEQSDNNVQKASEKLIDLGYEKRNTTFPTKAVTKKKEEEKVMNFMSYITYMLYTVFLIKKINMLTNMELYF